MKAFGTREQQVRHKMATGVGIQFVGIRINDHL
jgi:hypothetical protein